MKKTFILFSFVLCTAILCSCSKEQDRTSTGSPSNANGPAEDPYAEQIIHNDSILPPDSSSAAPDAGQSPDASNGKTGSATPAEDNISNKNNKVRSAKKDSTTGVAGQQGAGSGVGNGGSINGAQDAKKK